MGKDSDPPPPLRDLCWYLFELIRGGVGHVKRDKEWWATVIALIVSIVLFFGPELAGLVRHCGLSRWWSLAGVPLLLWGMIKTGYKREQALSAKLAVAGGRSTRPVEWPDPSFGKRIAETTRDVLQRVAKSGHESVATMSEAERATLGPYILLAVEQIRSADPHYRDGPAPLMDGRTLQIRNWTTFLAEGLIRWNHHIESDPIALFTAAQMRDGVDRLERLCAEIMDDWGLST